MKKIFIFTIVVSTLIIISACATKQTEVAPAEAANVSKQITSPFASNNALGSVKTSTINDVFIHRYHGSDGAKVNSYVIETKNQLVVIDTQYFLSRAKEFRSFVDYLEKPVERVIITRSQPGHFIQANSFKEFPIYAAADVRAHIKENGSSILAKRIKGTRVFKNEYPKTVIVPTNDLPANGFEVDGVSYELMSFPSTNYVDETILKIPSLNTIFASDLIESNAHLNVYNAKNYLDAIDAISKLQTEGYTHIFTGHDADVVPFTAIPTIRTYVETAQKILATKPTSVAYRKAIEKAYPKYGSAKHVVFLMSRDPYMANKTNFIK